MFVTTFAFFGAMCLGVIEIELAPGTTDRSGLPCFLPVESSWNLKSGNTGTMIDASGNIWASWQAIPSRLSSSGNNRSLEIVFVPPAFPAGKPQKLIFVHFMKFKPNFDKNNYEATNEPNNQEFMKYQQIKSLYDDYFNETIKTYKKYYI